MKTNNIIISCIIILLGLSVLLGFTFGKSQSKDDFCQAAPQGMIPVQSDSILPFYISVIEEPNINWQVYVKWLKEVFVSYPEVYEQALPIDTMTGLWQYYNDPLLDNYFEHPSYQWYPVTGVSWSQVQGYMEWKTDRLNEIILHKTGTHLLNMRRFKNNNNFNTEAYLCGQHEIETRKKGKGKPRDYRIYKGRRDVKAGDGIFFPQYRLPTEEEWDLANTFVHNKDNYSIIRQALEKETPLEFWQEYYHLDPEYSHQGDHKTGFDFSNFQAGVSEWLLDCETYQWQALDNNYEILLKNGWEDFGFINYDSYGQIREKDSLGKLSFIFVQVTGINLPLYMDCRYFDPYTNKDVYFPNPYYKKNALQMDSLLKIKYPNWYNYFSSSLNITKFSTFLDHMHIIPSEMSKDSLNKTTIIIESEGPKRKVKSGNFKNKTNSIEWLSQKSASPLVGFRCVLPFTGIPVIKGKKVKW